MPQFLTQTFLNVYLKGLLISLLNQQSIDSCFIGSVLYWSAAIIGGMRKEMLDFG